MKRCSAPATGYPAPHSGGRRRSKPNSSTPVVDRLTGCTGSYYNRPDEHTPILGAGPSRDCCRWGLDIRRTSTPVVIGLWRSHQELFHHPVHQVSGRNRVFCVSRPGILSTRSPLRIERATDPHNQLRLAGRSISLYLAGGPVRFVAVPRPPAIVRFASSKIPDES
jgi:hypothetical protein